MPRKNLISIRTGSGTPTAGSFSVGEPAFDPSTGKLWIKGSSSMVEIGAGGGGGTTDVYSYASTASFPATGSSGVIYIDSSSGKMFQWASTAYAELGPIGNSASFPATITGDIAVPGDSSYGNVSLSLHGDGSFADSSPYSHIATSYGNVAANGTAKFGSASLTFDGSGDYLTFPSSSAFDFAGDFTWEAWCRFTANANSYAGAYGVAIASRYNGGSGGNVGWQWRVNGQTYTSINVYTGQTDLNFNGSAISQNAWHHIAVCRSGSTIRAFVDGSQYGDAVTNSDTFTPSSSNVLSVGRLSYESTYIFDFVGQIDDLRLTKGVARFTGAYTPPTSAHPDNTPYTLSAVTLSATSATTPASVVDSDLRALLVPAAPTGVAATAGNAQASVSWTAPSSAAAITDYVVQYSSNGSEWTTASDGTSTSTSATVTGLQNGTSYTFRVAGVSGIGQGSYSTASSSVTPGGDGYFSNVSLLLHMDGSGSTFTDSSGTPKTVTAVGGATQSATQSKWGGKSAYFDGTGDYLTAGYMPVGSNDFTIEGWFYLPSLPSSGTYWTLFSHRADAGSIGGALLVLNGSDIQYFIAGSSGSWQVSGVSTGLTAVANQWMHIALARSGTSCRAYLDGTGGTAVSVSGEIASSGALAIMAGTSTGSQEVAGYCDDFRVTIGSSRAYTGASITVPTAAFPDS